MSDTNKTPEQKAEEAPKAENEQASVHKLSDDELAKVAGGSRAAEAAQK